MTRPSDCPECKKLFDRNRLLQAEMLHIAAKEGAKVAEMELNDRLEEEHGSHRG
jgi:hypothetical protein